MRGSPAKRIVVYLFATLLLGACAQPDRQEPGTVDAEVYYTEGAQTLIAQLTQSAPTVNPPTQTLTPAKPTSVPTPSPVSYTHEVRQVYDRCK